MLRSALGSSASTVASLSRAFAREIENLPTRYLREFYKIKVKDDVKALPNPESPGFKARYKRVSRELRKLEAANNGNSAAYRHILSLAYGRKGKLRRELMEPLLSDPSAPLPSPIIPPVESSRPPVYSPELTALLTSTLARHGSSSRTAKQLQDPPILPTRADPESPDSKTLGPLSKRREVNLRWRFFEEETARVHPPLEVSRVHAAQVSMSTLGGTDPSDAEQLTPPPVGFQGTSVFSDLESIASPNPNLPKRAANQTNNAQSSSTLNHFIRRQHRKLLAKIPIMSYFQRPGSPSGKYQVSLSPLASSGSLARLTSTVPMADEADLAWLRLPPPREPKMGPGSSPSQVPEVKAEVKSKTDRSPRVYDLKEGVPEFEVGPEPEAEKRRKLGMKLEAVQNPQVYMKLKGEIPLWPTRSNLVDDRPNQPKEHPGEDTQRSSSHLGDLKRTECFDGATGEKPQRRDAPPHSGLSAQRDTRPLKRGLGKLRPR